VRKGLYLHYPEMWCVCGFICVVSLYINAPHPRECQELFRSSIANQQPAIFTQSKKVLSSFKRSLQTSLPHQRLLPSFLFTPVRGRTSSFTPFFPTPLSLLHPFLPSPLSLLSFLPSFTLQIPNSISTRIFKNEWKGGN
jgi:hypothetical protein